MAEKTIDKAAANAARRAYAKAWRKKNRDKCREYQERYWTERAMELVGGGNSDAENEND